MTNDSSMRVTYPHNLYNYTKLNPILCYYFTTASSDFVPVIHHVVLNSRDENGTVNVPIIDDMDPETTEIFSASLMSQSLTVIVDSDYSNAVITVIDDDNRE